MKKKVTLNSEPVKEVQYPLIPTVDSKFLSKLTKTELVQRYLHDQEAYASEWKAVVDQEKENTSHFISMYIEQKNKVARIIEVVSKLEIPDKPSLWWILTNLSKIIVAIREIVKILKEKE